MIETILRLLKGFSNFLYSSLFIVFLPHKELIVGIKFILGKIARSDVVNHVK